MGAHGANSSHALGKPVYDNPRASPLRPLSPNMKKPDKMFSGPANTPNRRRAIAPGEPPAENDDTVLEQEVSRNGTPVFHTANGVSRLAPWGVFANNERWANSQRAGREFRSFTRNATLSIPAERTLLNTSRTLP